MMLTDPRQVYRPFEYPEAERFWDLQQNAHWLHFEIPMSSDIADWKTRMSPEEVHVVGSVLKGFTQMEVLVGQYWGSQVPKWFPKPEIAAMGAAFAAWESIHQRSYSYLNTSLGLDDFDAFLYEPTAKAKLDMMSEVKDGSLEDIAVALATYSALMEGVGLFSSFAILMSFSLRGLLKGMGQIIAFSIRDEDLHSRAGCWLFNQLLQERPELRTKELVHKIQDAARLVLDLELGFVDMCFQQGDLQNLKKSDLKNYMTYRINTKLSDIKIPKIRRKVDLEAVKNMKWFDVLCSGKEHQDFFAQRPTAYSKGTIDWSTLWDFEGEAAS